MAFRAWNREVRTPSGTPIASLIEVTLLFRHWSRNAMDLRFDSYLSHSKLSDHAHTQADNTVSLQSPLNSPWRPLLGLKTPGAQDIFAPAQTQMDWNAFSWAHCQNPRPARHYNSHEFPLQVPNCLQSEDLQRSNRLIANI